MAEPTTADPVASPTGYNVRDFVDAAKLKADLTYSPNDLSDAMMRQASLFSHYGVLLAQASHQVDVVKMLLENTEAAVYKMIRTRMETDGEKVTEPLLEKAVARHDRVIAMKRALAQAKRVETVTKTAVEAFRHRRDMLVQQGLISREEMKGQLSIAEKNAREEVQNHQRHDALARINALRAGRAEDE